MIIAKYKYDKSIYADLIPEFNEGYTGYTISDEIDSANSNHVIRTIECDSLPTLIRFGHPTETNVSQQSLIGLDYLNTSNLTSLYCLVGPCINIEYVNCSDWDTSNVTNMSLMFYKCKLLTSLDVSNWDTSKVTSMSYMFNDCKSLTSLDVSNFDTSNVTNMSSMFSNCVKLTSLDVSRWDTSKVTNMYSMFANCYDLLTLDVSNWDTSNVTSISNMFDDLGAHQYNKVFNLDLSNWDISNVNTIASLFACSDGVLKIQDLNITNWDISDINDINKLIFGINYAINVENPIIRCSVLPTIQILSDKLPNRSELNTPGYIVTSIRDQIDDETLATLTAKNWQIKDLVAQYRFDANTYENLMPEFNPEFTGDMYEVHDSVSEIVIDNIEWEDGKYVNQENGLLYNYDNDSVHASNFLNILENVEYKTNQTASMFWYNENKTYIGCTKWVDENTRFVAPVNAKYVRIAQSKQNEEMSITAKLVTRSIESKNGDLPTLMRFGYSGDDTENHEYNGPGMSLLKVYDLNTKELTTGYRMFKYCKRVESIKANWDTSKMTDMFAMFFNCVKLTELDVSNFNTSNVTSMGSMFAFCTNLTSLDVSKWNTGNVISMSQMLYGCNKLTSLDLSNFNTSNVTNMRSMFYYCVNLNSLIVSNFNTSKVTDMYCMFYNCNKLTTLDVSNWNTSNVTDMSYMFNDCRSLTSLDLSNWNTSDLLTNTSFMFNATNGNNMNLTEIKFGSGFNTSGVTNMQSMFADCKHLVTIECIEYLNTSNVTSMNAMFSNCQSLTSLDVSNWDTSKVTIMAGMFEDCRSLTSLDVSKWDTSKVTDMFAMFNNCQLLTSLDVSNWDTSNVTNMYAMFSDCANLSSLELTNWDVSKVTDIQYFLDGLELSSVNIKHLDLSFLELSSVTRMGGMFYKNRATDIKLPKVINPNLTSVVKTYDDGQTPKGMFYCNNLVSLDFGGLDISNVTDDKSLILEHVPKLRYIRTENVALIADLAQYFPVRTEAEQGYLITKTEVSDEIREVLSAKYWNVVDLDEVGTDVAIYKFDKSIYKWMTPEFDNGFVDWFIDDVIEDEVNAPNIVTRTIRSMGGLPTLMRFGRFLENDEVDYRLHSLIQIDCLNTNELKTMDSMFRNCVNVIEINTEGWNTSNIFYMNNVFHNCKNLTSLDVSNFDTSNVAYMHYMFYGCNNLTSLDVSNFNTSNVTNMRDMFSYCINLTSLDVSNFNTSKVTNMGYMFYNCNNLTSLDVSSFDTGNVTRMDSMFYGCNNLTSLDVSNFNTSKVTNMDCMFYNCQSLTSLDVSNFNTSNVINMAGMFRDCNKLTTLDVSNFNTSKVTDMSYMFWDCFNLTSIDVSNFDTGKVVNTNHMFVRCQSLTSIDVSNFDTGKVTNMDSMFWECSSITSLDVSNFNTSNVTNMDWMFYKCYNLTSLDVSNFDTSNVTSMNSMFGHCNSLTLLDVSNFNTSNVNSMYRMFYGCELITNIGMIYCDFKTVEKIASLVPTDNPTTIWVGNHIDFNALPQYDHITYKVYEVEDKLEFELSSPLLEGDRLEIIDGNLYHYHKMWYKEITEQSNVQWSVINDNEDNPKAIVRFYYSCSNNNEPLCFSHDTSATTLETIFPIYNNIFIPDCAVNTAIASYYIDPNVFRISYMQHHSPTVYEIRFAMPSEELNEYTLTGVKEWLKSHHIHVVYLLQNPYYELIQENVGLLNAEQGLYLNISDSVVSVVNNQDLCTIKLNYLLPNVEYKVKFKANNPGSIAINLGGTLTPLDIVEGWNEVMLTTPETLENEYLEVHGPSGIKIQNVMVIDSDKDFNYFKGMNNTFDELEVKNLCVDRTLTYTHGVDEEGISPQGVLNKDISKGKVVTVIGKVSNNPDNLPISINLYNDTGRATGKNLWVYGDSIVGDVVIYQDQSKPILKAGTYTISSDTTKLYEHSPVITFYSTTGNNANYIARSYLTERKSKTLELTQDVYSIVLYSNEFSYPESINKPIEFKNIQIEEGGVANAYEPPEFNVNDEPVYIDYTTALVDEAVVDVSTTDGYFAVTLRADRDYANRIGFNVGDAFSCEENDQVTITDLMVIEGDVLDCHPTTYLDPSDSSYLAEFKSYNNPYGFGKNKLI